MTYTEMFELLPIITNTASANYTVLQNEETQVEDKGKVKKKKLDNRDHSLLNFSLVTIVDSGNLILLHKITNTEGWVGPDI